MEKRPARKFQDLIVWKKSHEMVLDIYRFSECFPKSEMFGLISQMRRAAVSIPANIAEGFKRKTPNEKARFMNIAQGSLEETRYYLILAGDLGYGNSTILMEQLDEVGRLLDSYFRTILESA